MAVTAAHSRPERDSPEVEWSAALGHASTSVDRWVRYGMSRAQIGEFLTSRGADPEALFRTLEADYGPPVQVAVGQDGERGKLYWFLDSADPYFIGVDLRPGEAPSRKWYRGLGPKEGSAATELLPGALRPHLEWLLEVLAEGGIELFHLVLLSRETPPRYTGVHVGLAPSWEGLLAGDGRLLRREVVEALCLRLGLQGELDRAADWLFAPPMAWTAYMSLLLRSDGSIGVNVYTRASPVVRTPAGLSLVEPGRGGVVGRPVVIEVTPADWPAMDVRIRTWGDALCFRKVGPWRVDYGAAAEALSSAPPSGFIEWLEALGHEVLAEMEEGDIQRVLARLRERADVGSVQVGPDMRYGPPEPR